MNAKEIFLQLFDQETATTLRILRAFPSDQPDFRPHPKLKTARELAWVFVLERYLSMRVWRDEFKDGVTAGNPPKAPEKWDDLVAAYEKINAEYRALIAGASDAELETRVHFFSAPRTMSEISRLDWIRFLMRDEIHHRGQFSLYVRASGAKLPSIYGPTADERWF